MDCPLQYYGIDLLSEAKESGYPSFTEELPRTEEILGDPSTAWTLECLTLQFIYFHFFKERVYIFIHTYLHFICMSVTK